MAEFDDGAAFSQLPSDPDAQGAPVSGDSEILASLSLYISGCVGTLAAVAAVMQNVGPDALGFATCMVAIMGYAVSFFYRKTRLPTRLLNAAVGLVVVLVIASIATGRISIAALEPSTQFNTDLQLAVALLWLAVIYTWTLTDDRRVVTAAILAISTIGLVAATDVSPALIACFLVYIAATVFLLIHQNYLLHWNWGRAEMRRQGHRLLLAQLAITAVCWVVVVLAGMVLVVPLQAVGSHLSLSSALKGLILAGGGQPGDAPQPTGNVTVSDTNTFPIGQGGLDSEFTLDKQVIFHVYPSDGNAHYWRGDTYDTYTGQSWSSSLATPQKTLIPTNTDASGRIEIVPVPPTPGDQAAAAGTGTLITKFALVGGATDTLYLPTGAFTVSLPRDFQLPMQFSSDGHIQIAQMLGRLRYESASPLGDVDPGTLRKLPVPVDLSPSLRRLYLDPLAASASHSDQLRLAAQAKQIVAALPSSRRDEYDEATAIRGWVSNRATYSLDVAPTPPGQDAVSYFLYSSRTGYCDLYASSMALLCRYAGIPTRVATGFAPGVGRQDGGYDLRAIDKHAWCEVYFPGFGWVDFDPTSGTRAAPKQTEWSKLANSFKDAWQSIRRFYAGNGPLPLFLTIAIIGGLSYIVATEGLARIRARNMSRRGALQASAEMSRQGRDAAAARANAERRWQAARLELRRWNLRQKPSETAREFANRAAAAAILLSRRSQELSASIADAPGKTQAGRPPEEDGKPIDPEIVALALNQLADSYTQARYSASDERLLQTLHERDESGEGERELSEIRRFVARLKPLAGALTEQSPTDRLTK